MKIWKLFEERKMNEEMTDGDLIYLDDTPKLLGDNKRPDLY